VRAGYGLRHLLDEGLLAEVVTVLDATVAPVRTAEGEAVVDTTVVGPVQPGDRARPRRFGHRAPRGADGA
jgi:hypothetical protein